MTVTASQKTDTMDGNTAAAHVAYRVNEVWPTSGPRSAFAISGATSPSCRRCRVRAAPPARCMARYNRAR